MNLKKLIVPTLCVLLGCAGGAAMGTVTAQTWPEPTNVQRWQQECEVVPGSANINRMVGPMNAMVRARGAAGWELAGTLSYTSAVVCFKRPAP